MQNTSYLFRLLGYYTDIEDLIQEDYFFGYQYGYCLPDLRKEFASDQTIKDFPVLPCVCQCSNWFDTLPETCKHEIFKHLDHLSLVQFGVAFPLYKQHVINPVYWRILKIKFKKFEISIEEMKTIIKHLGESLEGLRLNLDSYNYNNYDAVYEDIFKVSKNLSEIDIEWKLLNSDHLIAICNAYPKLDSICIWTDQNIDDGLFHIIKNVECLKSFRVFIPFLDNNITKFLLNKHGIYLQTLQLMFKKKKPSAEVFRMLKLCVNLKSIQLLNLVADISMNEVFDSFRNLERLTITYFKFYDKRHVKQIFTQVNPIIKYLSIERIGISKENFESLAEYCPNLESLMISDCKFDEKSLRVLFEKAIKLKNIRIVQDKITDKIYYDLLRDVPKKILPNIEFFSIIFTFKRTKKMVSLKKN